MFGGEGGGGQRPPLHWYLEILCKPLIPWPSTSGSANPNINKHCSFFTHFPIVFGGAYQKLFDLTWIFQHALDIKTPIQSVGTQASPNKVWRPTCFYITCTISLLCYILSNHLKFLSNRGNLVPFLYPWFDGQRLTISGQEKLREMYEACHKIKV